jgi:hypothetical protein
MFVTERFAVCYRFCANWCFEIDMIPNALIKLLLYPLHEKLLVLILIKIINCVIILFYVPNVFKVV